MNDYKNNRWVCSACGNVNLSTNVACIKCDIPRPISTIMPLTLVPDTGTFVVDDITKVTPDDK